MAAKAWLSGLALLILCTAVASAENSLFADFGTRFTDAPENEATNDVHLGKGPARPMAENADRMWWTMQPDIQEGVTTARIIPFRRQMIIRFRADAFPGAHELTLTLRYKDDVHAPAPSPYEPMKMAMSGCA